MEEFTQDMAINFEVPPSTPAFDEKNARYPGSKRKHSDTSSSSLDVAPAPYLVPAPNVTINVPNFGENLATLPAKKRLADYLPSSDNDHIGPDYSTEAFLDWCGANVSHHRASFDSWRQAMIFHDIDFDNFKKVTSEQWAQTTLSIGSAANLVKALSRWSKYLKTETE